MDKSDIKYSYNPEGINEVVDELSATSFLALREVRWNDEDDYKPDIRRYFIKPDGTEMPGKGTAIGNPDGLTEILVKHLYGATEAMLRDMTKRDDYMSSMGRIYADYEDAGYEAFKEELDAERSKAILDKGMTSDEFMEALK